MARARSAGEHERQDGGRHPDELLHRRFEMARDGPIEPWRDGREDRHDREAAEPERSVSRIPKNRNRRGDDGHKQHDEVEHPCAVGREQHGDENEFRQFAGPVPGQSPLPLKVRLTQRRGLQRLQLRRVIGIPAGQIHPRCGPVLDEILVRQGGRMLRHEPRTRPIPQAQPRHRARRSTGAYGVVRLPDSCRSLERGLIHRQNFIPRRIARIHAHEPGNGECLVGEAWQHVRGHAEIP